MTESGEPVKLFLYDLSQGMAKQMSLSLTGKQIDGIWHTSVVVYDQEFFYGQGILTAQPGTTHHGNPLQVIDMGTTFLPFEVLNEYIESQRPVYTPDKYHLLDFNCNTFSNDVCQFLTGQTIPSHITDLPSEFLKTPFGQSLLPMIEGMFGKSRFAPPAGTAPAAPSPALSADSMNVLQSVSSAAISTTSPIQTASNTQSLDMWISSNTAVAVFFTSAHCPPCQTIKPEFERLIRDKQEGQKNVLGVIVDTSIARDAGTKYNISATPTFMFFHKGEKLTEFRGANYAELMSSIDLLHYTAYPLHAHRTVTLRAVVDLKKEPIVFFQSSQPDKIISKLLSLVSESGLTLDENQMATINNAQQVLEESTESLDMIQWHSLADLLLKQMPADKLFPFLDIFRALLKYKHAADYYTNDCTQLVEVLNLGLDATCGDSTVLMILRLACNIFHHPVLASTYFTSHLTKVSHRLCLTNLLISGLLADKPQVRKVATSLAHNCSNVVSLERLRVESGETGGMAEQEDDDWQTEIVCATIDALQKETDEEIVYWLLATIAKFLFLAPSESTLANVMTTLDLEDLLKNIKKASNTNQKIMYLAGDLERLIQKSVQAE